jgi:hypothetical protein
MAIFSNKIIEAYYVNAEKTAIEVIYKDGEKAISHYLSFDPNHPDFKDLINEYSLENILETTTKRLNAYREQLKNVVQGYQQNALKNAEESLEKIREEVFSFLISFDESSKGHLDLLFTLKLKLFEIEKVKNSTDEEGKSSIRKSMTPIDVLNSFKNLK